MFGTGGVSLFVDALYQEGEWTLISVNIFPVKGRGNGARDIVLYGSVDVQLLRCCTCVGVQNGRVVTSLEQRFGGDRFFHVSHRRSL